MDGTSRRKKILEVLREAGGPVSGSFLSKAVGVSRQIVVQDIALLRASNEDIISTPRGYVIIDPNAEGYTRRYCVAHSDEQMENELNVFVDLGAEIVDVIVEHPIYGEIHGNLNLTSRRDVQMFVEKFNQYKEAAPLMNVSAGIHSHTAKADSIAILDDIEKALAEAGYLLSVSN
ncbi:MAG: transcription repressor NadR [Firmicutes bacterium]|nr:transcription repressor NadR [Bacillota bacterium]